MTRRLGVIKFFIHLACLAPLGYIYTLAISGASSGDPVEALIHFTGIGSINLLFISLLISPLARRFKQGWLMQCRRMIGLYCAFYALLHIANYWVFELNLDVVFFFQELLARPYIWLGMVAFIILTVLSVTSFSRVRKRLGRRWQVIHNLTYLVVILTVWHFYWSVKANISEPLVYAVCGAGLLVIRFNKLKRWWLRLTQAEL